MTTKSAVADSDGKISRLEVFRHSAIVFFAICVGLFVVYTSFFGHLKR